MHLGIEKMLFIWWKCSSWIGTARGVKSGKKGSKKNKNMVAFLLVGDSHNLHWWPTSLSSLGCPQPVVSTKVRKSEAAEAFTGLPGCLWAGSLQASRWLDGVLFHWNNVWEKFEYQHHKKRKGQAVSEYLSPSVPRCWNMCWGWCGKHWDLAQLLVSTSRRAQHSTLEESPPGRDWFGLNRL